MQALTRRAGEQGPRLGFGACRIQLVERASGVRRVREVHAYAGVRLGAAAWPSGLKRVATWRGLGDERLVMVRFGGCGFAVSRLCCARQPSLSDGSREALVHALQQPGHTLVGIAKNAQHEILLARDAVELHLPGARLHQDG